MPERRQNLYEVGVTIPDLVNRTDTRIIAPEAEMMHNDALSGQEPVKVIAGPLQVTTSDGVYYLVKFHEDNSVWLCYADDLTDPR